MQSKKVVFYNFLLIFLCFYSTISLAQSTIYVSGTLPDSSIWDADTVKVTGDVYTKNLTIMPGTYVEMQGYYKIEMNGNGRFNAVGTFGDSIIFTVHDTTGFSNRATTSGSWKGLILDADTNIMDYCIIKYVKHINQWYSGAVTTSMEGGTSNKIISNSKIQNNNTAAAIFSEHGILKVINTILSDNSGGGISGLYGTQWIVENCIIRNNDYGIIVPENISPKIDHTTIEYNAGYGIGISESRNAEIKNCIIQYNGGTGIYHTAGYEIGNCIIEGNTIRYNMNGGINIFSTEYRIINNLIYGNKAECGGGVFSFESKPVLLNNTIYNNSATFGGGIFGGADMYNNIIRENITTIGKQVTGINNEGNPTKLIGNIYNSNVEGITAEDIEGEFEDNIDEDPLFANTVIHDFHLTKYSPCINTGILDTSGLYLPSTDLDGTPRILDFVVDIGAYEYKPDHCELLAQPIGRSLCQGNELSLLTRAFGGVVGYQWQKEGFNIPGATGDSLFFDSINISQTGNYNCIAITADSILSTDTVQVMVYPLPTVFLGEDTTIYTTDALMLDAGEGFNSYLWNTGAQDQLLPVAPAETGEFDYWVIVTDSNGCSAGDTILVTVEQANAIPDQTMDFNLKIYPNPISDIAHLVSSGGMQREVELLVMDLAGKILLKKNFNHIEPGLVYELNLSSLDDGLYILMIDKYPVRIVKRTL